MNPYAPTRFVFKILFLTVAAFLCFKVSSAQTDVPQQTIAAIAVQAIHFGTFCIKGNAGGTITVNFDGSRTCTGDIVLLPTYPTALPAVFEFKLCPGKNVSIHADDVAIITGGNGVSLKINVGPSEKGPNGSAFITTNDCNTATVLRVGGTLYIPANARPGNYSGNFNMSFKQE